MHTLIQETLRKGRAGKSKHNLFVLDTHEAIPAELTALIPGLALLGDKVERAGTVAIPAEDQQSLVVIVRLPKADDAERPWALAKALQTLPTGQYYLAHMDLPTAEAVPLLSGWALGQYEYRIPTNGTPKRWELSLNDRGVFAAVQSRASAIALVRDLINQPPNLLHPEGLEMAVREVAAAFKAKVSVVKGEELLEKNYPAIHAVGRGATKDHQVPRLIKLTWGDKHDPKICLVGKGVCFDTGGLDVKPSAGMRYMKKDMGGAATALGVAQMVMAQKLPICLTVLIPAVENAISADAYRPSDVIDSRQGLTIEVDNTDAEGRLILCDALTKAAEQDPELIIDFATLTGAARVAVGLDISACFSRNDALNQAMVASGERQGDPVWPLPMYKPYLADLKSQIADLKNCGSGFAGASKAALFLGEFVPEEIEWMHFDMMAWNNHAAPGRPIGGEAMGMLAVVDYLQETYG